MKENHHIYEDMVKHFINTGEMGHYNRASWSICLYNIENKPFIIEELKERINKFTTKYKFAPVEKHPGEDEDEFINVDILDICL